MEQEANRKLPDLVCTYLFACGRSFSDCVFLGKRHREETGDNPDVSDFWILGNSPKEKNDVFTTLLFKWKNWLTGIWRSPSGIVYVTDATTRAVHRFADVFDLKRFPEDTPLDAVLEGIWGLDDENLFAWGTRKGGRGKFEYVIFRFDGRMWAEMPSPGFAIVDVHGLSPDLIYSVGAQGGIARWDGSAWRCFEGPTREMLSCVRVAGADEVYSCGHGGSVLAGSARGWRKIAEIPQGLPAFAVAPFRGALYVGGGPLGLFRAASPTAPLELIKPNVKATWFDARDELVITCDSMIVGTSDGASFTGSAINMLEKCTGEQDILD